MTQEDKWFHALSLIIMKEKIYIFPKYHLLSAYSFFSFQQFSQSLRYSQYTKQEKKNTIRIRICETQLGN